MRGREGDYPLDRGVHVTRIASADEFGADEWREFVESCGIDGDVPSAVCVCTCRWSRPAPSRIMARSAAFVHRQLSDALR